MKFFFFRLVSGAGDVKLTKDGNVLLHEMVNIVLRFVFMACEIITGFELNPYKSLSRKILL